MVRISPITTGIYVGSLIDITAVLNRALLGRKSALHQPGKRQAIAAISVAISAQGGNLSQQVEPRCRSDDNPRFPVLVVYLGNSVYEDLMKGWGPFHIRWRSRRANCPIRFIPLGLILRLLLSRQPERRSDSGIHLATCGGRRHQPLYYEGVKEPRTWHLSLEHTGMTTSGAQHRSSYSRSAR